jgi:sulfur carrier protein ThiS
METVRVTAVLFGNLTSLLPSSSRGRTVVEVARGATVDDVLDALAVPAERRTYLTLDGKKVSGDAAVHDGAELRVIVPLGGG